MAECGFIGRGPELAYLESLWSKRGLVSCCVWGRRRVGKTTLLTEFAKGKRTLHLQGIHASYYENLSSLSADIARFRNTEPEDYKDLTHLMTAVEKICSEEHTLLIIDELPDLLESAPQAAAIIQKSMDIGLRDLDCMLVICGSSISVMRRETENADRPLYGRFDNVLQVKQMQISTCQEFHPRLGVIDALKLYMTVGGVPRYHVTSRQDYDKIVEDGFFTEPFRWKDDAPFVVLQEFRGDMNYTGVLKCISDGIVRQFDIAEKLMIDRPHCKKILDNLEFVRVIERVHPMAGAPKKPVYRIMDPFVAFYYAVVSRNEKFIESSHDPSATFDFLRNRIETHLGHMFEILCGEWIDENFSVIERGSWWGRSEDADADIDVVAKVVSEDLTVRTLACECKFTRKAVGFPVLNALIERCDSIGLRENVKYVLFSVNGFDEELTEYAEDNGILLVDGDMLFGKKRPAVRMMLTESSRGGPHSLIC